MTQRVENVTGAGVRELYYIDDLMTRWFEMPQGQGEHLILSGRVHFMFRVML
jgi:hypothetical protein